MIDAFSCVNLFSVQPRELVCFYHGILGIPVLYTLNEEYDGVNLGFDRNAPTICIWDSGKWGAPVRGNVSFVFRCADLDQTCAELKQKGISFPPPARYDWGVYELRLKDPDGNEAVVAEFVQTGE